jgi:hypothetical protein
VEQSKDGRKSPVGARVITMDSGPWPGIHMEVFFRS